MYVCVYSFKFSNNIGPIFGLEDGIVLCVYDNDIITSISHDISLLRSIPNKSTFIFERPTCHIDLTLQHWFISRLTYFPLINLC